MKYKIKPIMIETEEAIEYIKILKQRYEEFRINDLKIHIGFGKIDKHNDFYGAHCSCVYSTFKYYIYKKKQYGEQIMYNDMMLNLEYFN